MTEKNIEVSKFINSGLSFTIQINIAISKRANFMLLLENERKSFLIWAKVFAQYLKWIEVFVHLRKFSHLGEWAEVIFIIITNIPPKLIFRKVKENEIR